MKHLSIELSENSVEFSVLSTRKELISCKTLVFTSADFKKELSDFYSLNSFLLDDYSDITLAWSTVNSTLIPSSVFQESKPKELFALCFGDKLNDDIDYNRISELGLINLYAIPSWLKSFFIIKHPRIIIQHEGSHLLRASMNENAFKPKVSLAIHEDHFLLYLSKHNELEFYSYFEYQQVEDIVYHMIFTLQQKEFNGQKGNIEVFSNKNVDSNLLKNLIEHLGKIKDITGYTTQVVKNYTAKSQLLCV